MSPPVENILVIQLRQVGDVLLTGPVVQALRTAHPKARLDFLVEQYSAAAARGIPGVDETLELPRRLGPAGLWELRSRLRARRYDLAVDVQGNQKTAVYTWLSGAAVRLGFRPPWFKAHLHLAYTRTVPRNLEPRYTVHYRLDLLRPLGIDCHQVGLAFAPPEEPRQAMRTWLEAAPSPARGWIGLSPGGRVALKSWPLERYQELGRSLIERGHGVVVLFGPGEDDVAAALGAALGVGARLSPAASFEQHAALIELMEAVVVNDGGNHHLAAAVGTRSVTLFGPTDPRIWAAPDEAHHRALRGDCRCTPEEVHACIPKRCLVEISARAAGEAVEQLLAGPGAV